MTGAELTDRLLAAIGRVDGGKVKNQAKQSPEDWNGIRAAIHELSGLPVVIDDSSGGNIAGLLARAKLLKQMHAARLVIIDYLQLIRAGKAESRNYEIAEITRAIKRFAIDEQLTVILLSQLTRQADDGMPGLKDLRDSGAIESDADLVLFLCKPATDEDRLILVSLAKNRGGRTGKFKLIFIPDQTRFECYSDRPAGF